ncbi:hypothetical protein VSR01_17065 [Actinacidiphila sp. DG2A-62]|uniref:hypothetical protein n=1 Tax=Actinacidiphila sp. DG2A-62 TaxID=3108821 RepID=UPI002DBB9F01|nr:hypothetical protein [Actinacidiphila sp. DG2A-62]MEC3995149.1 hypothetical protein [Actinacidiphila sp. DG2A-62]
MSVRVDIDPTVIERALRRPGGIGARLLQRRAERVAVRARQLAPGTMADHITTRVEDTGRGLVAYVVSEHPASQYVIHGTRPHIIRPRRRVLRFEVGGRTVYAAYVRHPGNRATDFLGDALREAL